MSQRQLIIGRPREVPLAVSALVDMLDYARRQTLHAVDGLTVAQLDHCHDDRSNSIGALLRHIAAVEVWYQVNAFDDRDWTDDDAREWDAALDLGDAARAHRGFPLEHYLDLLERVRARTVRELLARDEAWLLQTTSIGDADANNYWKFFHVCEDEIAHTGQIRWLKKRLTV